MESLSFNLAYERLNHPLNSFTSFVAISFFHLSVRHPARGHSCFFVCLTAVLPPERRQGSAGKNTGAQSARMIFSPPTRRARSCAPVENGYLCFKEMRVSVGMFLLSKLSGKIYSSVNMTIDLLAIIGLAFSSSNPGKFNNGLCDCFFVWQIYSLSFILYLWGDCLKRPMPYPD